MSTTVAAPAEGRPTEFKAEPQPLWGYTVKEDPQRLGLRYATVQLISTPIGEGYTFDAFLELYDLPTQMNLLAEHARMRRDEKGKIMEGKGEDIEFIRELTLARLNKVENPVGRGETVLNLEYTQMYIDTLYALGVDIWNLPERGRQYLTRGEFLRGNSNQQQVVFRNNEFTKRQDVMRILEETFGPENIGNVRRVVEFIGGAKLSGIDSSYIGKFRGFMQRVLGRYEGETFAVIPASNSGPFYPEILDVAIAQNVTTASAVPHGMVVFPDTKPHERSNEQWFELTFPVLPADYVMSVMPGEEFGDELRLLIEHAISLAIMSQAQNCERVAILADGGAISVDEVAAYLHNFEHLDDSYLIILKDAGRLSSFLGLMLEDVNIANRREDLEARLKEGERADLGILLGDAKKQSAAVAEIYAAIIKDPNTKNRAELENRLNKEQQKELAQMLANIQGPKDRNSKSNAKRSEARRLNREAKEMNRKFFNLVEKLRVYSRSRRVFVAEATDDFTEIREKSL